MILLGNLLHDFDSLNQLANEKCVILSLQQLQSLSWFVSFCFNLYSSHNSCHCLFDSDEFYVVVDEMRNFMWFFKSALGAQIDVGVIAVQFTERRRARSVISVVFISPIRQTISHLVDILRNAQIQTLVYAEPDEADLMLDFQICHLSAHITIFTMRRLLTRNGPVALTV